LSAGLFVIALIDWPVQWLRRMHAAEDEPTGNARRAQGSEGSPERKAAQRERQRQYAMGAAWPRR
jgi:flagellar biosynthetic protein FlhB